ncbi:MAG: lipoprotein [Betaproteobacteria bacterium]|nr:lipoprotein [Betaproteobacteria bacterium]
MSSILRLLMMLFLMLLLHGCGTQGPLYLPQNPAQTQENQP